MQKKEKIIGYQMICAFISKLFRNTLHCCHYLMIPTSSGSHRLLTNKQTQAQTRAIFHLSFSRHVKDTSSRQPLQRRGRTVRIQCNEAKTGLDGVLAGYNPKEVPESHTVCFTHTHMQKHALFLFVSCGKM